MPSKPSKQILVAGDVSIDWLEIPVPVSKSGNTKRPQLNWQLQPGTRMVPKPGGALLLAELIERETRGRRKVIKHQLETIENQPPKQVIHSLVQLGAFPFSSNKKDEKNKVYRVKEFRGYSGPLKSRPKPLPMTCDGKKLDMSEVDIVVFDDAGNGFRDAEKHWNNLFQNVAGNQTIIYKMSRPLAQGKLWDKVLKKYREKLILVVSADDLRRDGVNINRRLSWERTAKDFVWQSGDNGKLSPLVEASSILIVCFGTDGAILSTKRGKDRMFYLYYDPMVAEDGFRDDCEGDMIGFSSAFVAGLTAHIARRGYEDIKDLGEAVRKGLRCARQLFRRGFGAEGSEVDYPAKPLFGRDDEKETHIAMEEIPIPAPPKLADTNSWHILGSNGLIGLEDIARQIVIEGEDGVLKNFPMGKFGKLKTVDRNEIESFRSMRNLMREYLKNPTPKRPLSIAVFGPPGSGKSFGVSEVAESIAPGQIEKLEFNMAQFTSLEDLVSAFHKVRNESLRGKTPLVFFDEFDSTNFDGKLGWLKYFLAPMQNGVFKDGETMHPIGKAIMVFAGGTSHSYQDFRGEEAKEKAKDSDKKDAKKPDDSSEKDAKKPDFISRLRGYINILGPDPVDADDYIYMIRRAMVLRSMLMDKAKQLVDGNNRLCIDEGVLRALLKAPEYKHGLRSLEAIIDMSLLSERTEFEQAALPPAAQIEMHADSEMFLRLLSKNMLTNRKAVDKMAEIIHENYRAEHTKLGDKKPNDPAMRSWADLADSLKNSNRQQAEDIVNKLRAIGCDLRPVRNLPAAGVKSGGKGFKLSKDEKYRLGKMEHERWVEERRFAGWRPGERDPDNKVTPYLVEWKKLDKTIQGNDLRAMENIPRVLAQAGFEIYRVKK